MATEQADRGLASPGNGRERPKDKGKQRRGLPVVRGVQVHLPREMFRSLDVARYHAGCVYILGTMIS